MDKYLKYITHIENGGRVLRVDGLNGVIEVFTINTFKEISDIRNYGINDLMIIKDDTIRSSDILKLLFNQKNIHIFNISDIISAISHKYNKELCKCTIVNHKDDVKINIDSEDGCNWQFKIRYFPDSKGRHLDLDASMILDGKIFILTIYPIIKLISPFLKPELAECVHERGQEELAEHGAMAWIIEVEELEKFMGR